MSEQCVAAEWVRDGRGAWAKRCCQLAPRHDNRHRFTPWQLYVEPPAAEPLGPELIGDPLTSQLLDLIRLMPDSQTQVIVDFIADMRAIRAGAK